MFFLHGAVSHGPSSVIKRSSAHRRPVAAQGPSLGGPAVCLATPVGSRLFPQVSPPSAASYIPVLTCPFLGLGRVFFFPRIRGHLYLCCWYSVPTLLWWCLYVRAGFDVENFVLGGAGGRLSEAGGA